MPLRPLLRTPARLLLVTAIVVAATAVCAAPDKSGDKSGDKIGDKIGNKGADRSGEEPRPDLVLELLQERGLLPPTMSTDTRVLVRQVRDAASDLVVSAMGFLGVAYRRGGDSPEEGFDCSGFTRHIFERSLGLVLPRRADEQARDAALSRIEREELQPGDLVFFNTMRRAFSHVGIYVGDGKFIHSPRTGSRVRVEDMSAAYWSRRFNGARRAVLDTPGSTAPTAKP